MKAFTMEDIQSCLTPYAAVFTALSQIPILHYLVASVIIFFTFLYNFLEFHFFQDLSGGGTPIGLTYHPSSEIYNFVVSKCKILHSRYWSTPWISSPHLQTCFLHFLGRAPVFSYKRQIFHTSDGGTIALDWLLGSDVSGGGSYLSPISKHDKTPIAIVIPGLTSDSASVYIKHIAYRSAKRGWNVVVSNHRGLGGVSITSDCFYNAGWTEDLRAVINYLHCEYPEAPLFTVGTSIGANVLVKYLGEDGESTPIAGGAAICNPWDLLIGDRFICRKLLQSLYDRALAFGLQGYAALHEPRYSRLANWEGITKARRLRDFDKHATCLVGKFETADTYYRHCSSSYYVGKVSVPLLCISVLDDPVCTKEAIPFDECRANPHIVLATTQHGGHLAFFEGLTAGSMWWVRAVDEFLDVLYSSPCMHVQKKQASDQHSPVESSIDQGPYVNVTEDGMLAAAADKEMGAKDTKNTCEILPDAGSQGHKTGTKSAGSLPEISQTSAESNQDVKSPYAYSAIKRRLNQICRQNRRSIWLLAFIALTTSWPLIGSALNVLFRRKRRNVSKATLQAITR